AASEVVDAAVASPTGGVITAGSAASAAADAESSAGDEDEQRHWHRKLMGSFSRGRAMQIIAADFIKIVSGKTASDGTPCSTVKNTDCAKPKGFFRRRQPSQEEIRVCNEKRVIQLLQCGGGAS
ncbi:unnamed protein product, partial [Closterium sp. Naga37s-1]